MLQWIIFAIIVIFLIWILTRNNQQVPPNIQTLSVRRQPEVVVNSPIGQQDLTLVQSQNMQQARSVQQRNNQVAALLELSGGTRPEDLQVKNTLQVAGDAIGIDISYYDTRGSVEETLALLDNLYNQGVRVFIGFSRSNILRGVKPWFDSHPDALAISPTSTAPSLAINDNIIRLTPNDEETITTLSKWAQRYSRMVIFTQKGDVFAEEGANILSRLRPNAEIIELDLNNRQDRLKLTQTLAQLNGRVIVVPFFTSQLQTFRSIAARSEGRFDVIESGTTEIAPSLEMGSLGERYYFLSLYTRENPIIRELQRQVRGASPNAYDSAILANAYLSGVRNFNGTRGIGGPIILDQNQDRTSTDLLVQRWNGNGWNPLILFGTDPNLGEYEVDVYKGR